MSAVAPHVELHGTDLAVQELDLETTTTLWYLYLYPYPPVQAQPPPGLISVRKTAANWAKTGESPAGSQAMSGGSGRYGHPLFLPQPCSLPSCPGP